MKKFKVTFTENRVTVEIEETNLKEIHDYLYDGLMTLYDMLKRDTNDAYNTALKNTFKGVAINIFNFLEQEGE